LRAIGDSCADQRWQDHHVRVVVFFVQFIRHIKPLENYMSAATIEDKHHEHDWHALHADAVLQHLEVQQEGLSSEEVERRLLYYGPNQLKEAPRPGFLALLWAQLNNFVVILLIVASVISALLGDYVEAAAIMAIVVLNSVLGIVQEQRAEQALAALKKLAAPDAQVLRDGVRRSVPS
jgi:P-type Ca2+ transporter type 2C